MFNMKRILLSTAGCSIVLLALTISCTSTDEPTLVDCSTLALSIPAASIVQPTGCGETDGSITVQPSGGAEPYQFSVNGTTFQTNPQFNNLAAGTYTVTIKDANDCTKQSSEVQLTNPNSTLAISETIVTNGGCKTAVGSITITASGGQPPYTYSVNGSSFVSNPVFASLDAGSYTAVVKDANQCTVSRNNVKVVNGVSFDSQIKSIIQVNCVKSGCHNGGNTLPNFSNLSTVQANASRIKTAVLNGSMPKDGSLTQAQKDLIACWVDDGAPAN